MMAEPNQSYEMIPNNTVSPESSGEKFTLENHIWIYTAPVIWAFGICANILTMVVMRRPRMRGTSTSVYLTMLALGDVTVIVVGLTPEWLYQLHLVAIWDLDPWLCRVEMYLYYTSLDFAIWVLMAFSCDRFIAVCFPLKKRKYCTAKRAYIACGVIFIAANLNAHVFWTRGTTFDNAGKWLGNCRYLEPYEYFELSIRPFTVLTIAFILPFFVIAISNIIMVVRLTSAQDMRRRTMTMRTERITRRMRKGFTQTTAMCLSACVAFLILVLPNIILFIGKQWWSKYDQYHIAKAIASQLVYIHHSINFVLYSVTGKRFRGELAELFVKRRRQRFMYKFHLPSFSTTTSQQHRTTIRSSSRLSSGVYRLSPSTSPLMRGRSSTNSPNLDNGTILNNMRSNNNRSPARTPSPKLHRYVDTQIDLPNELSTIQEVSVSLSEDKPTRENNKL